MPIPFLINGFVITCTYAELQSWKLAHNHNTSPTAEAICAAYGYGQNRYQGD